MWTSAQPSNGGGGCGKAGKQLSAPPPPPPTSAGAALWKSSLLRKRVAAGAVWRNVALAHAADMLRSEAARMDGQLLDDFGAILRGNAVYIHNFICDAADTRLYDALKSELVAATGATMAGAGGLIEWSKHQVFENPTDISATFADIIAMLDEYFDLDVYATRLNYYRDGTQWKPQHHDSHAYGGRALREDFTVGLTLGATRSLLFVHEASQLQFSFPQANGDCFAFTGEVNQSFTHGVPRTNTPTADRFSIIAWGRRRTLNERNSGAGGGVAATQLQGRAIHTMEDAVAVAKEMVTARSAAPPSAGVAAAADDTTRTATAAAAPQTKRKKNRLQ
ncbi:2OG-Fe(II) oxygenase superfamily [Novymonas esmeraldas]|uniref:2OG-Fe(II) oxygenase superfamily n=1 Tax=Novymonas esmeraldas TaxID=1808958 RepID=A0AAW0F5X7_9TRYP